LLAPWFFSGPDTHAIATNDRGQNPTFLSNTLLVKLTPHARANLEVTAGIVNPAATGLPSLDLVCREHAVKSFRSVVAAGAHRTPGAAINSWFKLTLAGPE